MYNVKDLEKVKENWRRFWNHEFIGRPYMVLTAPKNGYPKMSGDTTFVKKLDYAQKGDFRSAALNFEQAAKATMHYGESLPHFNADFGPDQYAAFYGIELVGREGEQTTWVKKTMGDELSDLDLKFDRNNEYVKMFEKAVRTAAEIADGNFIINVPDSHSNMDTLSALISPQNLCYEIIDNPDVLEEKLNIINNDYEEIYNLTYEAGNMKQTGTTSWLPLYCEGKMAVVQCDFSCMISPDDARRFLVPSIYKELQTLDHAVYHYDGKMALGHFEDILAIDGIDCIQWAPGAGQNRTIFWMDLLKRIQEKGKSVWIGDWTPEEILADTELDPALTVFSLNLKSEAEAEEFMYKLEQKYRNW